MLPAVFIIELSCKDTTTGIPLLEPALKPCTNPSSFFALLKADNKSCFNSSLNFNSASFFDNASDSIFSCTTFSLILAFSTVESILFIASSIFFALSIVIVKPFFTVFSISFIIFFAFFASAVKVFFFTVDIILSFLDSCLSIISFNCCILFSFVF